MKRLLLFIIFISCACLLFSDEYSMTIKSLPQSVDEYLVLRDEISKTPKGWAAMMIVALLLYSQNQELGKQCLVAAVAADRLIEGNVYKGFKLMSHDMDLIEKQIARQKYIPKTYFRGARPDNNYELPKENLVIEFKSTLYSGDKESGSFKLFVYGSGADTPRPITVTVNEKGIWKASEWSSLIEGVKIPKAEKRG